MTLAPSFLSGQAKEDYLNWIRQIQTEQIEDGTTVEVVQDVYIDSEGVGLSQLGIPEGGAIFQLWTMDSISGSSWLLDTDVVGSGRPQANIYIDSVDSHAGIARTRVDIPFSVAIDYLNIQESGEGVDEALTKVRSYHYAEGYESEGSEESEESEAVAVGVQAVGLRTFGAATSKEVAVALAANQNANPQSNNEVIARLFGSDADSFLVSVGYDRIVMENIREEYNDKFTQILPQEGQDVLKIKGVENYVVEMVTGVDDEIVLSNEKIEVYSVPDGAISGFNGEEIKVLPEEVNLTVNDAYPGSKIILRLTVSTPLAGGGGDTYGEGHDIELVHKNISPDDSADVDITFSEWEIIAEEYGDLVNGDLLTLSLISKTKFSNGDELIEVLSVDSAAFGNELKIRAGINTLQ